MFRKPLQSQMRRLMTTFRSPVNDIPMPSAPLADYVFEFAHKHMDKPALVDGSGSGPSYTYGELLSKISGSADGLDAIGFKKGDVLSIHLPNCPQYASAFFGASAIGATNTTSNPLYTAEELAYQLSHAKAKAILTHSAFRETAEEAASQVSSVESIHFVDDPSCFVHRDGAVGDAITRVPIDVHEDLAVLPYSSGTTGRSKGVMLTHANLTANTAQLCDTDSGHHMHLGVHASDKVLGVLPFFHIYGMVVIMAMTLRQGATVVTMPRFDPEMFLKTMADGVTWAPLVPPIILFMAKHPAVKPETMKALKTIFSGAAPLDKELTLALASRFEGLNVCQGWGMSELSPVGTITPCVDPTPGSAGRAVPNTELQIRDADTGKALGVGERGELCVRGPQVMKGYLDNPSATEETIGADGFLRTGDIAYIDDDGDVFIVDRLKELIKVSGFQVPPAELEALLLTHPDIADAAVVPMPHERSGEVPKAFVVVKEGHEVDEDAVKEFVAEHVVHYKRLAEVQFIDAIPKSAAGKILRRILRDM
jgi:acyl-CoA synthetase (AMP-forming)/AMP-acid ligase II